MMENSEVTVKNSHLFKSGQSGNPKGRPPDTEEKRLVKKAVKELLKEYEQTLSDALPELSPILIAEAKKGNMKAFKEIHDVVGARKSTNNTIVPIQINFGEDREEFK